MSTSATIESRVPSLEEMAPLVLGLPHTDEAWFHAIANQALNLWVNATGGNDGVLHENDTPIDFGKAGDAKFSLTDLLEARENRNA